MNSAHTKSLPLQGNNISSMTFSFELSFMGGGCVGCSAMVRFRHGVEWSPSFAKILCQFPSGIHPTIMHNKKARELLLLLLLLLCTDGWDQFDSVRFGLSLGLHGVHYVIDNKYE